MQNTKSGGSGGGLSTFWWALAVVIFTVALFGLAACGKGPAPAIVCTWSVENSVVLSVGPVEKAKCPNDEFIVSYTPIYKPGGEVISIDVQCARRVQKCVSVSQ